MIGSTAGVLASMLGIGGGLITVPFLFYIFGAFGLDPSHIMHLAVGTSFAIIVPTSIASVLTHHKFNAVDVDVVKSYGIHVAKLAGIPETVIQRAKYLLSDFMDDKKNVQKPTNESYRINDNQLLLFEKFESKIIEEIKKINLNNISPIEALNILNEIKKKV